MLQRLNSISCYTIRCLFLLVLLGGLAGCATPRVDSSITLRWPDPPLESRIEVVRTIYGGQSRQSENISFWESVAQLLGVIAPYRGRPIGHPADIVVSPDGSTVYVSDFAQGIIHVFDLNGGKTRYFGLTEELGRPFGLALDSKGRLYVAEQLKRQIRVLDSKGETLNIFHSEKLIRPIDIAIDEQRNRLYVVDGSRQSRSDHYVRMFDLDGAYLGEIGNGRGNAEGKLLFPTYVQIGHNGDVYVSDTMNARVSVFSPDGQFLRVIGKRGDGFGLFDKPKGIALDSFGNIYVADSSWSNIQIFGPQGHVLLYFGSRGGYPGLLRNPTAIAIAQNTNTIYVADYLNHRLCVYQLVNTQPGDGLPQQLSQAGEVP